MQLSPEERRRIYEEEKARIEAREQIEKERLTSSGGTSTGLAPNVAGLLCYIAGWVSGLIFLILEQKNNWVRFHAAQSIVTFGILTLAGAVLGNIPFVGPAFAAIIGITGFVLWIVLMVKAINGERYKLIWVGDIAESMVRSSSRNGGQDAEKAPESAPAAGGTVERGAGDQSRKYVKSRKQARMAESAIAIAWSIALLIFFNFFNQYVAYYHSQRIGSVTVWTRRPFFTDDINLWLPILTATLAISIAGHVIAIILDKYIVREIVHIVVDIFSLATVLTLLVVFPFNFNVIPSATAADATQIGVTVVLVLVSVGIGIGLLVRLIKFIINLSRGFTRYQEED